VVGLATVSPNGCGIIDGDGICGEIGGVGANWHVARVEPGPGASGTVGQGRARSTERRLGDGMVLNVEDKLDGVVRSSADTAGSESKIVGATNNNLNGVSSSRDRSGSRRRSGSGSGGGSIARVTGRALSVGLELSANCKSGILEVCERVGGTVSATVDGVDHATIKNRRT